MTNSHFEIEIWRLVPSFPELAASSWGRVMVVPYMMTTKEGRIVQRGGWPNYGQLSGTRYLYRIRRKNYRVHRLVCEAFHGPPPYGRNVCMHKDENSLNNRPKNLEWGTQKENLNAPGFLKYCKQRLGVNSPTSKGLAKKLQDKKLEHTS